MGAPSLSPAPVELDLSPVFVTNLDRSPLGRFAMDESRLRTCDGLQRSYAPLRHNVLTMDQYIAMYNASADFDSQLDALGVEIYHLMAELVFWCGQSGEDVLHRYSGSMTQAGVIARVEQLKEVAAHQDMHDYFWLGLWDVDRNAVFVAAGIDADLAVSLGWSSDE